MKLFTEIEHEKFCNKPIAVFARPYNEIALLAYILIIL